MEKWWLFDVWEHLSALGLRYLFTCFLLYLTDESLIFMNKKIYHAIILKKDLSQVIILYGKKVYGSHET